MTTRFAQPWLRKLLLDLARIVARFEPLEERHRLGIVIGHVALEEVLGHAGFGLADVPELRLNCFTACSIGCPSFMYMKKAPSGRRFAPDLR